ncbi:MAG: hypothetical protein ABF381_02240 [Akkermansiaceae bacterium]
MPARPLVFFQSQLRLVRSLSPPEIPQNSGAAGYTNNFTVQEVRLAVIPEPPAALLALVWLGWELRRRR